MKARCVAPTGAAATRYGEKPLYAEGLYDLGNGIHAWMVPNGSWGEANAGLVAGAGASLLIDTLWDEPKTRVMLDAMAPITAAAPITTVVNTHADGDHFWGNALLPGAETIASERAREEMDHHRPGSMRAFSALGAALECLPGRELRAAGRYFRAMCAPYDFATVRHRPARRTFAGEAELDIGGRCVRLVQAGPAHTQGDTLVHIPDARTLFAADILFIGSTPVMWAGPVENWLKALDAILDMDVDTIVPGHGPVTAKDGVRQVRVYWEFAVAEARRRFDAGLAADAAAWEIVTGDAFRARPFAAWDSPERMMTNVHLLYRQWAGETRPTGVAAKINIMRKQAVLAAALADARPAVMHGHSGL